MEAMWGLALGAGAFLVWWSWWPRPERATTEGGGRLGGLSDRLVQAGVSGMSPQGLIATAAGTGGAAALTVAALSSSVVLGLAFGLIAARAPFALVAARARRRSTAMREVWPEAVDHLASGIRAGLSLPEALGHLAERGPEHVRAPFAQFAHDYRATGRFSDCLDGLKARLADPVADRIIEALRVTREVGGTDIGRVLRTLGEFLREDARLRAEIEARQSWTVNAARLAVTAPWVVLALLSTQPGTAQAYNSAAGVTVLMAGGAATVVAYRLMARLGRLPAEQRVMR